MDRADCHPLGLVVKLELLLRYEVKKRRIA
jgi:hypothetical protein